MVGARVRRQQVAYAQGARPVAAAARAPCSRSRDRRWATRRGCAQRDAPVGARVCASWPGSIPAMAIGRSGSSWRGRAMRMSADRTIGSGARPACRCRKRRPRRRVATGRPRPLPPTGINHVWAYDFVFDTCADGRALKCLTVVDEFTRECLAIDVAGSIRSGRVIEVLTQLVQRPRRPAIPAVGQWPRVRGDGDPALAADRADRHGLHRPGQALAEWHGRIVQREVPRRVLDAGVVSESGRGEGRHRALAAALQRRAPAHEPRRPDAGRVQGAARPSARQPGGENPRARRSPIVTGPKNPGRSAR